MSILIHLAITALFILASTFSIYNYYPIGEFIRLDYSGKFGTTLTDVATTDSLSDFPTLYNANLALINAGKVEVSTTTMAKITSLTGLTTVGTIATGVWNATTLTVTYGGTGSTTLSAFHVLTGSSTNAIGIVSTLGTSGQFLTSQGVGLPPYWTTSSIDEAGKYDWTGGHTFTHASTTYASTTVLSALDGLYVGRTATTTIVGDSTATSTFAGNLKVTANATTTNLYISGEQVGGRLTYTGSSTVAANISAKTFTGSIPTIANFGIGKYTITDTDVQYGSLTIARVGATTAQVSLSNWGPSAADDYDGTYTFTWSGANLAVAENEDANTDSSIGFTIYWYR